MAIKVELDDDLPNLVTTSHLTFCSLLRPYSSYMCCLNYGCAAPNSFLWYCSTLLYSYIGKFQKTCTNTEKKKSCDDERLHVSQTLMLEPLASVYLPECSAEISPLVFHFQGIFESCYANDSRDGQIGTQIT